MAQTLAQKLRIKEGTKLFTLHAPAGFAAALAPLPAGVKVSAKGGDYDQVHWFVRNKAQVDQELAEVIALLHDDVLCWIYYPKGTSGIQTDLTRDKGWGDLHGHKDIQWLTLVSFDDTWSAFAMRLKTAADRAKGAAAAAAGSAGAAANDYVDRVNKTVRLPEDLESALKKSKTARAHYDGLSYSCRREYVEWVIGAKRPETRMERVKGTVERLEKGWKNPRNI
ncbi:MAG TPA: YdeI/OmpD-associated family protein [Dinghuibacter sp.]|uniref:YdeI/OmpD-associated family protein n=1 Tax=Dinghuibacter sp. TaxID=2024697 RepID=UPI002B6D51D3|nr:YdeI/OmpD-associated family protein [Dinghuibacter sp.]HTJ12041.1 YdeI/OmpD-associated family protein [Dinghuibacter sp.]